MTRSSPSATARMGSVAFARVAAHARAAHVLEKPPRWLGAEAEWLRATLPVVVAGLTVAWLSVQRTAWPVWIVLLLADGVLYWRRQMPMRVFAVSGAAALVLAGTSGGLAAALGVLIALYNVAIRRPFTYAMGAGLTTVLGLVLIALDVVPSSLDPADLVLIGGLLVAVLLMGTTLGANRRYLGSLEDRARAMEHEREQQDRLIVAAERTRIAREMHDVVAHGLTIVLTLAQGAAVNVTTDPDGARDAMEQVAGTARQSLWEMRRLLGVLRDESAGERQPQPGLADLDHVLGDVRATGLRVDVSRSGEPRDLGPALEATIVRIAQEALTNVLKHGRRVARASVTLSFDEHGIGFVIEDDGQPATALEATGSTSAGRGLAGMRERAAMFDGTVSAGPCAAGWRVSGRLNRM